MKKKESLADKLAAGTAIASVSASWWPSHTCSVSAYIKAMHNTAGQQSLGDNAMQVAKQWDTHVGDSQDLMILHTSLELALVDAAARADSVAIDEIQRTLEKNIVDQLNWHARRMQTFPKVTFEMLMRTHIRLFLEAVIHKMDGNNRKLSLWDRKRGHNAVALGALMTEWM